MDSVIVKLLVRGLYDSQKLRIQLELRIKRLIREKIMTQKQADKFFELSFDHFVQAEKQMEKHVWAHVKDMQIVRQWLGEVKGIGPRLSGLLVANIIPIDRFDTISKLWAYAGLHVIDGAAVRRVRGQKSNWNSELQTTAWKIAGSLIKTANPYRTLYLNYKKRIIDREMSKGNIIWRQNLKGKYEPYSQYIKGETKRASQNSSENQGPTAPKNPEWTLKRVDNMAMRYIAKRLLSHLWQVWREMEGLPCRPLYVHEYLNHQHKDDPWDYIVKTEKKKTG